MCALGMITWANNVNSAPQESMIKQLQDLQKDVLYLKARDKENSKEIQVLKQRLGSLLGRKWKRLNLVKGRSKRNLKPYPIEVAVSTKSSQSHKNYCYLGAYVNNRIIAVTFDNHPDWAKSCALTFTVPPNAQYRVEATSKHKGQITFAWVLE